MWLPGIGALGAAAGSVAAVGMRLAGPTALSTDGVLGAIATIVASLSGAGAAVAVAWITTRARNPPSPPSSPPLLDPDDEDPPPSRRSRRTR